MSNEHWEEINEWDVEEDFDLAKRITVHSVDDGVDEEEYQLIQAHKQPTYAAAAKWGGRKSSSSSNEETTKVNNIPNKTSSKKKKPVSSTSQNDGVRSADTIPKDIDHDIDYDTLDSKHWKETRRSNTKLHKVHSEKLMTSLISNVELELNQDLVRGDTNRNPEFKKYKILKKSLAINKKFGQKSKNDRKSLGKLHVEVW